MADPGLTSSIWASPSRRVDNHHTTNDWYCSSCNTSNFEWRRQCRQCSSQPPSGENRTKLGPLISTISSSTTLAMKPGPLPRTAVPARRNSDPIQCTYTPSTTNPGPIHTAKPEEGLSKSRWAPRNGERQSNGHRQIWTKTNFTSNTKLSSNTPRVTTNSTSLSPRSSSPTWDIDLPYQVQHFILSLVQNILEEACFDFGMRWLPQELLRRRWDCAEAVELSTWKSFLPSNVPPYAVKAPFISAFENALANAVRLRNAGVHRHLCTNAEVGRMVSQAADLMAMLSDGGRHEKLQHLSVELNAWIIRNRDEPSIAREMLERALRSISECPIDDMDWTPNTDSLQQVLSDDDSDEHEDEDMMDLDI